MRATAAWADANVNCAISGDDNREAVRFFSHLAGKAAVALSAVPDLHHFLAVQRSIQGRRGLNVGAS